MAPEAARREAPAAQTSALLLIDLQEDFLARAGLAPPRAELADRAARLVAACRERGVPVLHVRTGVRPDGSDRMPHWKRAGVVACVDGTPGARPPAGLEAAPAEPVFRKRFFGAFGAPGLAEHLRALGARRLILAGVYLHSCVRESALEAYERGYEVWIAEDAVGSTEPVHAELARSWLAERAARFACVDEVLEELAGARGPAPEARAEAFPVACIGGVWRAASGRRSRLVLQPSDPRVAIGRVPRAEAEEVEAACAEARRAGRAWARRPAKERAELLRRWALRLGAAEAELAGLVVREVGKPLADARAELRRARAHVEAALRLLERDGVEHALAPGGPRLRHRPAGTVALITPWNNPVAIPAGKIAPALAFGNGVVWKPASEAPGTAMALLASLLEAGAPPALVSLLFGEADSARRLIADPSVDAVSVTGSEATGRSAAALCAQHGKRLQAELGGNNAAIVLADCDAPAAARGLARAAFGFAGQRCTAIRRILVERAVYEPFGQALAAAARSLRVGDPAREDTEVGPLVSARSRERVAAAVEHAAAAGGRILCGGGPPDAALPGSYFLPTLVADLDPSAPLVQEETFGPVAVLLPADDLDDAIRLANGVRQGLVASLCTRSAEAQRRFADAVEAGILTLAAGALAVHPDAPFGGWKASGLGPPEHGAWDREFYARPQALYGAGDGA